MNHFHRSCQLPIAQKAAAAECMKVTLCFAAIATVTATTRTMIVTTTITFTWFRTKTTTTNAANSQKAATTATRNPLEALSIWSTSGEGNVNLWGKLFWRMKDYSTLLKAHESHESHESHDLE